MSHFNPDVYPDEYPTEELPPILTRAPQTWLCYLLLVASAAVLLAETLGPIWLPEHLVLPVVETVAALAAVVGLIEGALIVKRAR